MLKSTKFNSKIHFILCSIILLFMFHNTCLGITLERQIKSSTIIFKGKLINKYDERRQSRFWKINNNGEKQDFYSMPIFTIFVFSIDEILKGEYNKPEIEVMLFGGCENGKCTAVSHGYSYDIGENALLFLTYRSEDHSTYRSLNSDETAYTIMDNGGLLSKIDETVGYKGSPAVIQNNQGKYELNKEEYYLTTQKLKNIIKTELSNKDK